MKVMKVESATERESSSGGRMTNEQLINELSYYRAERMTKSLLDSGLITDSQYDAIMAENRRSFKPYLAEIF